MSASGSCFSSKQKCQPTLKELTFSLDLELDLLQKPSVNLSVRSLISGFLCYLSNTSTVDSPQMHAYFCAYGHFDFLYFVIFYNFDSRIWLVTVWSQLSWVCLNFHSDVTSEVDSLSAELLFRVLRNPAMIIRRLGVTSNDHTLNTHQGKFWIWIKGRNFLSSPMHVIHWKWLNKPSTILNHAALCKANANV